MAKALAMKPPLRINPTELVCMFSPAARRNLTTLQRPITLCKFSAQIRPAFSRYQLQPSFRRSFTDALPPKPRRWAGFFRWAWRVTYLSAIGGIGYLGYIIYDLRTPPEQFEPDPSKKTLVILGIALLIDVDEPG